MTRILLLAFLLGLPSNLVAQPVTVRSGDHAGFSRLLINFDVEAEWEFGRVDNGFEFRPANKTLRYDLSPVFELITRDRIVEVEDLGGGRLFLRVDCDCHGDAFDLRGGQVVLDIKDGPPPNAQSRFEQSLADPADTPMPDREQEPSPRVETLPAFTTTGRLPVSSRDRAGLPLTIPRHLGDPVSPEGAAPRVETFFEIATPDKGAGQPAADAETAEAAAPTGAVPGRDRVPEIETALLEQIARAAGQGLLEADLKPLDENVAPPPEPRSAEPLTPPVETPPEEPTTQSPRGHIEIETGVDRATARGRPDLAQAEPGRQCAPPEHFDVAAWGSSKLNPGRDIGTFRSAAIGEFDSVSSEGITGLVRHYVFMTFGAEAKALIRRYPNRVAQADVLAMMADVMDSGFSATASAYVEQMQCPSHTALWAVLAQPALSGADPINTEAVTLAFAGLPRHLRDHLGPGLSEKLLNAGDRATADMVRNATGRGTSKEASEIEALNASFDILRGEPDLGRARLDTVIARADDVLPEALLKSVEATLVEGGAVPQERISLLESLAYERRGSAGAARFLAAAVRAHASVSSFDAAFARLSDRAQGLDETDAEHAVLRQELFRRLADDSADATFLRLLLPRLDDAVGLPAEDRRRLAARLLDLGLPLPGRRLLGGDGDLPEPLDRLLYARAALMEGRPDVAIGYLAGIDGEDAGRLRASALERASDHAGALRAHLANGDGALGENAAWRGGLWEDLTNMGEGPRRDAAMLMIARDGAADGAALSPSTPLASSTALIENSREARAVLDRLLQSTEVPRPADAP
ncbi:hypothetical protein [Sinisalibacter lacisalsi]|uniref:HEAT repeat domain-containing protein n=1 Tax=Sinisalibacter lacisalsi TaxID=1526570 RepID=A0ABQ1QE11_9RHOB|nr:hypothetical protein [Sinisalibacter lacisalsi]GGD22812.1 hypothetical protein GCM10011358_04170 [Sinisalibacter lacisalsi]